MKDWVGWPVVDGLPTLVVTHQLQVKRRTGKVRQSETDVLPLCYATNLLTKWKCDNMSSTYPSSYWIAILYQVVTSVFCAGMWWIVLIQNTWNTASSIATEMSQILLLRCRLQSVDKKYQYMPHYISLLINYDLELSWWLSALKTFV